MRGIWECWRLAWLGLELRLRARLVIIVLGRLPSLAHSSLLSYRNRNDLVEIAVMTTICRI
jgi:hypothetical protein